MVIDLLTDQVVFLTQEQGEKFISYIDNYIVKEAPNGIEVPFNISCIEKIICHPKLHGNHEIFKRIIAAIKEKNLNCEVDISDLYNKSW